MENIFTMEHLATFPEPKKEEWSLQDGVLEKVPVNLPMRTLTSHVNACKLALYIPFTYMLDFFAHPLLRFSLSQAFHNAGCPFKAHSRLMYGRV